MASSKLFDRPQRFECCFSVHCFRHRKTAIPPPCNSPIPFDAVSLASQDCDAAVLHLFLFFPLINSSFEVLQYDAIPSASQGGSVTLLHRFSSAASDSNFPLNNSSFSSCTLMRPPWHRKEFTQSPCTVNTFPAAVLKRCLCDATLSASRDCCGSSAPFGLTRTG